LLENVSLPAAVVFETALANNIAWMQRFADGHGAKLAPHGKTTMAPALFRRQIQSGAWGITLATATQCAAAFAHGAERLLMANQLVGVPNMAIVAGLVERGADYCCLVDSAANVAALNRYFGQRGLTVQALIELGVSGGRCGVRNDPERDALVDAIAAAPAVALCGIEGYEGLIGGADAVEDIRDYGRRLVETVRRLRDSGAFADRKPIITAAGSQWFDLVAEAFDQPDLRDSCTPLLRRARSSFLSRRHGRSENAPPGARRRTATGVGGVRTRAVAARTGLGRRCDGQARHFRRSRPAHPAAIAPPRRARAAIDRPQRAQGDGPARDDGDPRTRGHPHRRCRFVRRLASLPDVRQMAPDTAGR